MNFTGKICFYLSDKYWTFYQFTEYNLNRGSENYGSKPCSGYHNNNDDELVDFVKTFKLEFNDPHIINKISGTGQTQTAYRIEPEADLALPTRFNTIPNCLVYKQYRPINKPL